MRTYKFNFEQLLKHCCHLLVLFSTVITSCTSLVKVEAPDNNISTGNAFKEDGSASAVVTGFYASMVAGKLFDNKSPVSFVVYTPSLSADELMIRSNQINDYYYNNLAPNCLALMS